MTDKEHVPNQGQNQPDRLAEIRDILAKIEAHTNPQKELAQKKDEKSRTDKAAKPSVRKGLREYVNNFSGLLNAKNIFDAFGSLKGMFESTVQVVGGIRQQMLPAAKDQKKAGAEDKKTKPKSGADEKTTSTSSTSESVETVVQKLQSATVEAVKLITSISRTDTSAHDEKRTEASSTTQTVGKVLTEVAKTITSATHDEKKSSEASLSRQVGKVFTDVVKNATKVTASSQESSKSTSVSEKVASTTTDLTRLSTSNTVDKQTGKSTTGKKDDDRKDNSSSSSSLTHKVVSTTTDIVKKLFQKPSTGGPGGATVVRGGGMAAGEAAGSATGGMAEGVGAVAAGGEAAGGAAGGAGGAMGGVASALASNPVGWVVAAIAAVAAVVVAIAAMPFIIKKWGESLLESQRQLAESSGAMAAVFAKKDVADTMREQRIGDATAESAGGLSDALIRLEDRIEPFTILVSDFLNTVMTGFVEFATGILDAIIDGINLIIDALNVIKVWGDPIRHIEANTRPKQEQTSFGQFLGDWAKNGPGWRGEAAHAPKGPVARGLGAP